MTAESNETEVSEDRQLEVANATEGAPAAQPPAELPREIVEIFEFLSHNNKIVFKSQQIDDPELQRNEKVQIARDIYAKNRQTFLMRFGSYLEEHHLASFARLAINDAAAPLLQDESCEEMQLLLVEYRNRLHTREKDVKNRRYAAMQQLIAEGEYFSEQEMMRRAPELYQELIGQYLSEAEKKQRDTYDVKNTTFSGILMHTMEQQQIQDVLKQADKENMKYKHLLAPNGAEASCVYDDDDDDDEENSQSSSSNSAAQCHTHDDEVPAAFRQQWGNFDNEQVACSTSRPTRTNMKAKERQRARKARATCFITAGERNLLRQEFIGIMHEQFLAGNDADFDYTQVDDNSQLDDLSQLNRDKEDAYFEESDSETDAVILESMGGEDTEESEDELDLYMSHLNKHHSLQSSNL